MQIWVSIIFESNGWFFVQILWALLVQIIADFLYIIGLNFIKMIEIRNEKEFYVIFT